MTKQGNSLAIWENETKLAEVRTMLKESYGANLTQPEWNLFMQIGKATQLNPFMREIWAVKYNNTAASIFVGRDGYRRSAQADPDYEYHMVDAVYSKDTFDVSPSEGKVHHKYNVADRGELLGAYCLVKRKSSAIAAFNFAELKEYRQKFGVWTTKPATMIKKVAEAQGLRGSFQALFAGTYEESENWQQEKPQRAPAAPNISNTEKSDSNTEKKSSVIDKNDNIVDAEVVEHVPAKEPMQTVVQQHDGWKSINQKPASEPLAANETPLRADKGDSTCMQCGMPFKGDAPFCPKCTAALEQDANDAGVTTQQQPVTPPSSTLKLPIKRKDGEINMTEHTRKKMYAVWSQYFKLAIEKKAIKDDTDSTDLRREKMKKLFAVESSKDLGDEQAKLFIERIEKEIVRLGGTLHTAEVAPPPESPTPVYSEAEYAADEQAGMELM